MSCLLLSGGGSAEDSLLLDQLLVQLTAKGQMVYVPLALDPQQRSYASGYEWVGSVFTPLGLDHITMWSDVSAKTEDDLKPFAALYIGGGNTFKLLRDLKQARFDQVIRHFLHQGGIVYGGSAGAIICGRDISTASWCDRNDVGLEDTTGLDLLQGASVWCHYQPRDDQQIRSFAKRLQHPIIALGEKTGLYVQDSVALAVGFEPVVVFHRDIRQTFPPSSAVLLSSRSSNV
jgi:dipeptidase E